MRVRLAADFEKVRRASAVMADHVHGRHGEPRAVGEHAHVAVEVDVLESSRFRPGFQAGKLFGRAGARDVAVAHDRAIVHHELAVERDDAAVPGDDQRIDFQQLCVEHGIGRVKLGEHVGHLAFGRAESQTVDERRGIRSHETAADVDGLGAQFAGRARCHFLDIHAALGRKHDERAFARWIVEHCRVQLAFDRHLLLDQHLFHFVAANLHADDGRGMGPRFLRRRGRLDAARLAALADRNLGLDDDGADPRRDFSCFVGRFGEPAPGNGYTLPGEERLRRVFLEVHRSCSFTFRVSSRTRRTPPPRKACVRGWCARCA